MIKVRGAAGCDFDVCFRLTFSPVKRTVYYRCQNRIDPQALRAVVTAKHWESAAGSIVWLQNPTPAPSSFESHEEAVRYWRRWSKLAAGSAVRCDVLFVIMMCVYVQQQQ